MVLEGKDAIGVVTSESVKSFLGNSWGAECNPASRYRAGDLLEGGSEKPLTRLKVSLQQDEKAPALRRLSWPKPRALGEKTSECETPWWHLDLRGMGMCHQVSHQGPSLALSLSRTTPTIPAPPPMGAQPWVGCTAGACATLTRSAPNLTSTSSA